MVGEDRFGYLIKWTFLQWAHENIDLHC